ncbi:MAG: hypothetical protein EBT07_06625 [Actinobacteria bacterium]|nr:hypothetical protein [Actinomycetota bacterium]
MKIISVTSGLQIPNKYTGIVQWPSTTEWYKKGFIHREDGPAIEYPNDRKEWFLNGQEIYSFNVKDYIVVEQGIPQSQIKWLGKRITNIKILTENGFMYIPDLPGILI